MPAEKTGADALRWYYTGATVDGRPPQTDPNASLGNFPSGTEIRQLWWDLWNLQRGITVEQITGGCGEGEARLEANGSDGLRFVAPGEEYGGWDNIATGQRRIFTSGKTEGKMIRVHRWGTDPLQGICVFQLKRWFNNAIAMGNVTDAQMQAGDDKVRCIAFFNETAEAIIDNYFWVKPLGNGVTTDVAQLPASGTGTIQTSGSAGDFASWPRWGWARIETSGGSWRESVLYTLKADENEIEVEQSNHRGLLGSSASAGAATDRIYPVPGIRLALQQRTAGKFSVAADERDFSQLGGLTWNSGIRKADGLNLASLASTDGYGLWIRWTLPACNFIRLVSGPDLLSGHEWQFFPWGA